MMSDGDLGLSGYKDWRWMMSWEGVGALLLIEFPLNLSFITTVSIIFHWSLCWVTFSKFSRPVGYVWKLRVDLRVKLNTERLLACPVIDLWPVHLLSDKCSCHLKSELMSGFWILNSTSRSSLKHKFVLLKLLRYPLPHIATHSMTLLLLPCVHSSGGGFSALLCIVVCCSCQQR